jgi:lipoteichoic acid synthase
MRYKKKSKHSRFSMGFKGLDLLLYFVLSLLFMELVLRFHTAEKFFSIGILYSLLFASSLSAGIYLVVSFFKVKKRNLLSSVILVLMSIVFYTQFIYFKFFKTFYTVFSAGNGGMVLEYINAIVSQVVKSIPWLIVFFLPSVIFILFLNKKINAYYVTNVNRIGILIIVVSFHMVALGGIYLGDRESNTPYDLYFNNTYPVYSVNNLGLITTMRLDFKRNIIGFEPVLESFLSVDIPEEKSVKDIKSLAIPETPEKVIEYNVMDIDFDSLITNEKNETIKNMHQYFSNIKPTTKNDRTGKYKDYNLILITAEGYSHYAVDKDVTPTLYKMQTEGINFTNFYTALWGVSTSDGEYVATTSLIPKSGVWSYYKSGSNSMPFAMGNQLKELGYSTKAYHNHTYTYYKRHISHPNMGYDYKGIGNGLNVRKTWPESDIEMMEKTVDEYIKEDKFHTYYMTVSGHMRYTFDGNFIAAKNKALVKDLPYNNGGKAYMATQIELDRALEYLLKRLDEAGIAEKTLIAISADHYPYGLEEADLDNLAGHTVEKNFELYKSSFILYTKGMKPEVIERPASSLDIIPTIDNLMGIKYDSRLLMGTDIFSDQEPLVILADKSFISSKGRYNAATKEFTPNPGMTVSEDYRKNISEAIDRKFTYSALILDNDYYSKVLK